MDLNGPVTGTGKYLYLNGNPGTVSQAVRDINIPSLNSKGWNVTIS
jgi:hypothetical protein